MNRHQADRSDVVADLRRRAKSIAVDLGSAFGGQSQVAYEDIGAAVAGQIRNGGLTVHGTVEEVCVAVYEATLYPGDDHYPAHEPDYDDAMPRIVGACLDRIAPTPGYPQRYLDIPFPLAHPERQVG